MADLTITATSVVPDGSAIIEHATAGVALTAGQVVYKAAATGKLGLADSNSGTAEVTVPYGIALHAAAANQPIAIIKSGKLTIGATLTPGVTYALSETPGGIQPSADLTTGEVLSTLGLAISASVLQVRIAYTGVTL